MGTDVMAHIKNPQACLQQATNKTEHRVLENKGFAACFAVKTL